MDSTNLSANQASYTRLISSCDEVTELYQSPKERKLDFHQGNHYLSYLLTSLFQYIKSHLLQLVYLKNKWNAFPVFLFYTHYSSFTIHKNKVINKNC